MSNQPPPQKNRIVSDPQIVPQDVEAEEALLGSILINTDAYFEVAEFMKPEYFYIHRNRFVWEAIAQVINDSSGELDLLTVLNALEKLGHLEEVGGASRITQLMAVVPTSLHAVNYARIVENKAIRRSMLEAANQIARIAYDEKIEIKEAISASEEAIFGVGHQFQDGDMRHISKIMSDVYDDLSSGEQEDGVPTGFLDLDKLLTGLRPSDLIIVAGRPGMGKSGFATSIAKHAALTHKKSVVVFSLEMSGEQQGHRLLSQSTGIDSQRLRSRDIHDHEWPVLTHAIEVYNDTQIFIDDTPGIGPSELYAKCRRLHMEYGLDLIIVDYLQLMTGDDANRNREQEVAQISRFMKVIARKLNVPVMALAQLSRNVEHRADKKPVLSDLRESGSLEQDSDVVMFIYRPEVYDEDPAKQNIAEIIVAKHRNGPIGSVQLVFRKNLAKFENAAMRPVM